MGGSTNDVINMAKGKKGGGMQPGKDLKANKAARWEETRAHRGAAAQHESHQWTKHKGAMLPPLSRKQMDKLLQQQAAATAAKADPFTMLVLWTMMARK